MPVAVAVTDQWSDGKRLHVIGTLTPSGLYPAGGDVVDFRPVVQSSQAPLMFITDPVVAGFLINGSPETLPGASKIKCVMPNAGSAASKAASTLTGAWTGAFTSGKKVVIGAITYTLRTALTVPAVAYEILLGADEDASLHNLFLAITGGAGAGTLYSTGTLPHPLVTSADVGAHAIVVTAIYGGTSANAIATTTDEAKLSWPGATMNSGTPGVAAVGAADPGNADWPISTTIGFYAVFNQLL